MSPRVVPILLLPALGCLGIDPGAAPPVTAEQLVPRLEVAPDEPVSLHFSGPVEPSAEWPLVVRGTDGRAVPCAIDLLPTEDGLSLTPEPRWPASSELFVSVTGRLDDADSRPVAFPSRPLRFVTRDAAAVPAFARVAPAPGAPVPWNLRRIVVRTAPGTEPPRALTLTAGERAVAVPLARLDDGEDTYTADLGDTRSPCRPLCPGERYTLALDPPLVAESESSSWIETGTVADQVEPDLRLLELDRTDGTLRIAVWASEPVTVRGEAVAPSGERAAFIGPAWLAIAPRLTTRAALRAEVPYQVRVVAEDAAGQRARPLEFTALLPARPSVRINELVPTPLHDWNEDAPGTPLDDEPGSGSVSPSDEWVELLNTGDVPIDLEATGLMLRSVDTTPAEIRLSDIAVLRFGRGGTVRRWGPDETLVVRPPGSLPQRDFRLELRLGDAVLDAVEVSAAPGAQHAGGRPPALDRESIARDLDGRFRWCAPTPGQPLTGACVR